MKTIVLCADDYGQSAAISAGILQLVERGRLSAVSCMTDGPVWRSLDNPLPQFADRIDIGLHFNLTHALGGAEAQPLSRVLRRALTLRIDTREIVGILDRQLDRFEERLGNAPDFVDGHQHVHVFPQIRKAVLQRLAQRYPRRKPYLRAVNPRLESTDHLFKKAFLKALGIGFSASAKRRGMETNSGFSGIYGLRADQDFAALMNSWIEKARSGDLLMCHPGRADRSGDDPIAATRPLELEYLLGADFAALLAATSTRLGRMRDVIALR